MSYETLMNQSIIEQLYEEYKKQPVVIPKEIEDLTVDIKLYLKDMEKKEILNHYQDFQKDIQKL